jgi:hypothetical protein
MDGLFETWELVPPSSLCFHVTLRGRPRMFFPITSFDGPTLDRIYRRLQQVYRVR